MTVMGPDRPSVTARTDSRAGGVWTRVAWDNGDAHDLYVQVGKAGTELRAVLDLASRWGSLALQHGCDLWELMLTAEGSTDDRSSGDSVPNAISAGLLAAITNHDKP